MNRIKIIIGRADSVTFDAVCLPAAEIEKSETLTPDQRPVYRAARQVVRQELAALLGCKACDVPIVRRSSGKPVLRLEGGLFQASPPAFSLSHTGVGADAVFAVAVSASGSVGVDIESFMRQTDWRRIAARRFHADEWQMLQSLPQKEGRDCFTRLWCLKEASVKLFEGKLMPFLKSPCLLSVLPPLSAQSTAEGRGQAVYQGRGYHLFSQDFPQAGLALGAASRIPFSVQLENHL